MKNLQKAILIMALFNSFSFQFAGGFSSANRKDCDSALDGYVQQNNNVVDLYKNARVLSCEMQVVAGFNYRMTLKLSNKEQCSITIYKDLSDNYSVNDMYEDTCSQMAATA